VREAQGIDPLFTLMAIAPFWFISLLMFFPNSPIWVVLSLVPFTAPVLVMLRLGIIGVPTWQLVASMAILIASVLGGLWIAAKLLRIYLLMYGKRPRLREIVGRCGRGRRSIRPQVEYTGNTGRHNASQVLYEACGFTPWHLVDEQRRASSASEKRTGGLSRPFGDSPNAGQRIRYATFDDPADICCIGSQPLSLLIRPIHDTIAEHLRVDSVPSCIPPQFDRSESLGFIGW